MANAKNKNTKRMVKATGTRRMSVKKKSTMKSAVRGKAVVARATRADGEKMHISRPRARKSWLARSKEMSRRTHIVAKNVIIALILLAGMLVVLVVLLGMFKTPERTVTGKIYAMAEDYYENYLYDNIVANVSADKMDEALSKYAERGFAAMDLKQLLLFDNGRHSAAGATLKSYCDETGTYVKIYPEAPFGRKDYRIEANYACNF
ncbi:hypothetical protein IJJ39_02095 [Candidatus Saccharibacteria bacterium]|nr:hypothetical protein [Candidatus Saccharibacteria bacterium]